MKHWPIFLIFSVFILSCTASNSSRSIDEGLLWGDWYGGPGTKYSVIGNKKEWIQDLPAGNALFVHGKDHIFINHSSNTQFKYELRRKKIYYEIDKPANTRYYIIETLSTDSFIVVGPYKDNNKLYVPNVLYRLSYYRLR